MPEEIQKEYELVCILLPQLEGVDLENVKKEIEQIITKLGGTINFKETKKHDLAYPINKQGQGIYLISQMSIPPEKVANLSNELKLNKQVLRHLISQIAVVKPAIKRERRKKPVESAEHIQASPPTSTQRGEPKSKGFGEKDKVQLEEIDKKLDEIIKEI
ncbi:MAG TPA: 30S ribosomal protein S6 [bacterium]|nr:30S ribosomal protein S6 [bacterium]